MKHLYKFSLLLLAFLLPATTLSHDFEVDGIYYNINGTEATVTSCPYPNKYTGDVAIPASVTYGGTTYSVTSIGEGAFEYCTGLTSITILNSIMTIGDHAFRGCKRLTSITIPNSVTSIGNYAFYYCTSLTNITIPNSVTSIGSTAFTNTAWYNNQPDGLVYAGLVAYEYKGTMPSGTSITLRNGTLGIASSAFYGCNGLTSINIPNSVTFIGRNAFIGCTGLTSIVVASGNPTYDSRNNCNAIIETASNTLILGCTNTILPNSVSSIGDHAFYDCSGLTSVTIPNSVTTIGGYAFYGCTGLTNITIPNSVFSIGDEAFSGCSGLTSATIGNSVTEIGENAFFECVGLSSVSIPNSVTAIGSYAFYGCSGLIGLTIGNSVTSIGEGAFAHCNGLTSIVVANGNPTYDSRGNCNAIIETATNMLITGCQNTIIPNSVTAIGVGAFAGCTSLTSITIPNSVTYICVGSFSGCSGLTSITIPNSVTNIDAWAFYDCSGLAEICSFALAPPKIETFAFSNFYDATLYVPEISMEAYKAAAYWNNFTNVVGMPYTFEVDGTSYRATTMNTASVIANNDEATLYSGDVVIPDSVIYEGYTFAVTGIESNAFDGCFELTSVVIPNSVTDIGEQAFQGCTGLTSVTIGSSVTAIGAKAFNYCNALETVKCLGTVPPVMASTDCFTNTAYNRATLLVPRQFVEAYQAADYWYKFAHIDGWGSAGRGDIDGDGIVSINDVTRMIDVILTGEHEGVYFESADLNSNGRLDIGDVTTIIDMLLNGN